jgi:5-methylcytosine-specific restriction endonuclease McrA
MAFIRAVLKEKIVQGYGGKCACCGESEIEFLTVDHVVPVRRKHVAQYGTCGSALYRKLLKEGFPKDNFQLLCFNCNMAKRTSAECPHQRKRLRVVN